jgi:predicted Rossmann-fold nucleotide-binding protein
MPRKPIVAVIGGNKTAKATEILAELVGGAVVLEGAILLTGSQPMGGPEVKRAAMRGASFAAGAAARLIGVLPRNEKAVFTTTPDRQRLIETHLLSGERNPINSLTSDVVLTLMGGSGTLAEVGFAVNAKKPIIFVDCVANLKTTLETKSAKSEVLSLLQEGINAYPTGGINNVEILRQLQDHLNTAVDSATLDERANASPRPFVVPQWALALARTAIAKIDPIALAGDSGFPGIPDVLSKKDFQTWLCEMP